jgi:hypothetical protein
MPPVDSPVDGASHLNDAYRDVFQARGPGTQTHFSLYVFVGGTVLRGVCVYVYVYALCSVALQTCG